MEMVPEDFNLWMASQPSTTQTTILSQIVLDVILFLCLAVFVVHVVNFLIKHFSHHPSKERHYKLNPLTPDETRRLHYGITIQKVILKKMQLVELKIGLLKAILSSLKKKRKVKHTHYHSKNLYCACSYCNNLSTGTGGTDISLAGSDR